MEVHASEVTQEEQQESAAVLTKKVASIDPGIVYNRSYGADRLLGSISETAGTTTTFHVTPYENRIIIPRLGKNIPIIDVSHGSDTDYASMEDIFMDELKK